MRARERGEQVSISGWGLAEAEAGASLWGMAGLAAGVAPRPGHGRFLLGSGGPVSDV